MTPTPAPYPDALHAPDLADEAARVRLGASAALPAEAIDALAADTSVMVRAALALNATTPHARWSGSPTTATSGFARCSPDGSQPSPRGLQSRTRCVCSGTHTMRLRP